MNTRALLVPLCCCLALAAQHSAFGQRLFDLGPKAGISSNDLSVPESHDAILGWQGGLFARVKPPLLPGVQGEVLLSSLGSNIHFDGTSDVQVRALALQTPIFLVFGLGPLELHAGGYYDFLLDTSEEGGVDSEGEMQESGGFEEGEHGLLAGLGVHVGQLYAGVRYNYGLKSVGSGGGFLDDAGNRQAQAYIGIGLFKAD